MAYINTTIIVSGIQMLLLIGNSQNEYFRAENATYGLSYSTDYSQWLYNALMQQISNETLTGVFLNKGCWFRLNIYQMGVWPSDIYCGVWRGGWCDAVSCAESKVIFTEIRQTVLTAKIVELSDKLDIIDRKVGYLAGNRAWW
jgi:hypothetical protein